MEETRMAMERKNVSNVEIPVHCVNSAKVSIAIF
jgi:hypothetical protein